MIEQQTLKALQRLSYMGPGIVIQTTHTIYNMLIMDILCNHDRMRLVTRTSL